MRLRAVAGEPLTGVFTLHPTPDGFGLVCHAIAAEQLASAVSAEAPDPLASSDPLLRSLRRLVRLFLRASPPERASLLAFAEALHKPRPPPALESDEKRTATP
jgi:hypothetical protein